MKAPRPPLAVTMGEPAGIGPDIVIDAVNRGAVRAHPFVVFGDPDLFRRRAAALEIPLAVAEIPDPAERPDDGLAVIRTGHPVAGDPGRPTAADAPAVIASIEAAVAAVAAGTARAVVTPPISKKSLAETGFAFPGHTEFLGALAERHYGSAGRPVMLLAADDLKVVPVTVHIPLAEVPRALTTERVVEAGRILADALATRFGIAAPRIAVAGLNPHAGEEGILGAEDEAVVRPAVAALVAAGIEATGPHPADALFTALARPGYDAALAMYHDQALIPVKTLAFDRAVNVTLGLPFVRTSPDHGTAFPLAGTGKASPDSFLAALALANSMTGAGKAPADAAGG